MSLSPLLTIDRTKRRSESGGSAILRTDYDYFAWDDSNGNGRLKQIKSEDLYPSVGLLQDLRYYDTNTGAPFYDAVGNDSYLNRWTSPDSIIPDPYNPLDWDRYSYSRNNPVKYVDPTGHWVETTLDIAFIAYDLYQINQEGWTLVNTVAMVADVACAIVPIGTGGGPAVRAAMAGGDAVLTYSRAAAQVPDVIRAGQAAEKLFQFADSSNGDIETSSTQGHHPGPQYLLGPEKQELYNLDSKLHTEYHSPLDRYLSRRFGTENYVKLFDTQEKINQLLEGLKEFNKYFDKTYKTHTYEALEDVLRNEGYLPKP